MFSRWRSTVRGLITSSSAICSLVCASAISLTTCSSRGVNGSDRLLGTGEHVADQPAHRRGIQERLTAHRRPARLHEVAIRAGLQHVARRSRLQRLEEVLLGVVHREHQDPQLRAAASELGGRLQTGQLRHRDVQHGQVDVSTKALLDRLRAVARLGDHLEVWLGVEHHAQPTPHHRVVVGEQDPRRRHGNLSVTDVPPPGASADLERAADEQGTLAHPAHAGSLDGASDAATVIPNAQHASTSPSAFERERDPLGAGMAQRVRHRLLRHAIDDDLGLAVQRDAGRRYRRSTSTPVRSASTHSCRSAAARPRSSSASGPQVARDRAHLLERRPRRLARLADPLRRLPGDARLRAVELQQHRGQRLPDLVVQLARDPQPLVLLSAQRPSRRSRRSCSSRSSI